MNNIVYMFGAGASANSLPTIATMPNRMEQMINLLKNNKGSLGLKNVQIPFFNRLLDDLQWLMTESKKHATIDTFARKIFITKGEYSNEYEKMKNTLSVYFALEQANNKIDYRYDTLLATILNDDGKLPTNVKFLSWNYDIQMELAYLQYVIDEDLNNVKGHYLITYEKLVQSNKNNPKLLKLNGTAGIVEKSRNLPRYFDDKFTSLSQSLYKMLDEYGLLTNQKVSNLLSYSWENPENKDSYNEILKSYYDTHILVVIGYSFPFFNRNIDKIILQAMIDGNLQKIYIQDMDNADNIKQRIIAVVGADVLNKRGISIIPISDCENFYIPYEM